MSSYSCPHCGAVHTEQTCANFRERAEPDDGDISICFSCGDVSIFDVANHVLRRCTVQEQMELDRDAGIQNMLKAWREVASERQQ